MYRENVWECGGIRIDSEALGKGAFSEEKIILMKMVNILEDTFCIPLQKQ